MTNFLSRLAARAVGVAYIAQPLVPAMFNPGSGFEAAQRPAEIAVERFSGPPATVVAPEGRAEAALPRESIPHRSIIDRSPQPHAEPAASPFSERQVEPARADVPARETLPAIQSTLPAASDEIGSSPDRISSQFEEAGSGQELKDAGLAEPDHAPGIFPSNRQSVRALNIKPALSAAPPASPRNRAAWVGPERPVVRVTIGRIDVRAQFTSNAPAPSASRPHRAATLSLDDYLKQRSEGKR